MFEWRRRRRAGYDVQLWRTRCVGKGVRGRALTGLEGTLEEGQRAKALPLDRDSQVRDERRACCSSGTARCAE